MNDTCEEIGGDDSCSGRVHLVVNQMTDETGEGDSVSSKEVADMSIQELI